MTPSMYSYWGKARPSAGQGVAWHPVVYHSLDVAAVAHRLLERDPRWASRVAEISGLPPSAVIPWLTFAIALHDLGKFTMPFQAIVPELAEELHGRPIRATSKHRHDSLGFQAWEHVLSSTMFELQGFRVAADGQTQSGRKLLRSLLPWMAAVTGHHGIPPIRSDEICARGIFPPSARAHAQDFLQSAWVLLSPPPLEGPANLTARMKASSWLVAGLVLLADWLGSGQQWFPYDNEPKPLSEYWQATLRRADRAIDESRVVPPPAATRGRLQDLCPALSAATPTPLQDLADKLELGDTPHLIVAEEVTGGGKTEAALLLAHRLLASNRADGVYVALPTMATANGMYPRVCEMVDRLFASDTTTTVLAHGAAHVARYLVDGEADLREPNGDSATHHAKAWLTDSRKKALLAPVGVGTIDQALLGVLPSRHGVLRLAGLCRHVLIVDEAHAYDAYMQELLGSLLEFQARLGGHAIILSATLPMQMRQRLVDRFREGVGEPRAKCTSSAFPLVTSTTADTLTEHAVESRASSDRVVGIEWLQTEIETVEYLSSRAAEGQCAVWIRNTVPDAISAYTALREAGVDDLQLFHARYAMVDRQHIERQVLRNFGRDSNSASRRGRVVVATQVVEQSLDLDFDLMVSDLAPIDLLLQRAGRLHRHARASNGDRVRTADQRPPAVLKVLAPPWSPTPPRDWVASSAVARSRFVYPDVGGLWRTQRILRQQGALRVPSESRLLVEAVYGRDVQADVPDGLLEATAEAEGKRKAETSIGQLNVLRFEDGYVRSWDTWLPDTQTPTRLGDPTTTIRLATEDAGRWTPYRGDPAHPPAVQWSLAEVSVRASRLTRGSDSPETTRCSPPMPDLGRWSETIYLRPSTNGWTGVGHDSAGREVPIRYSQELGLMFEGDNHR